MSDTKTNPAPQPGSANLALPRRRYLAVVTGNGKHEVIAIDPLEFGRWERELSSVRRIMGVV